MPEGPTVHAAVAATAGAVASIAERSESRRASTPTISLYDATNALLVVRDWLDEHEDEIIAAEGDLSQFPELLELIDASEGTWEQKAENVGLYVRELVLSSKAIKEEADRLKLRAERLTRRAESLKNGYLLREMCRASIKTVEGKRLTVAVQANPAPSIVVVENAIDLATAYINAQAWSPEEIECATPAEQLERESAIAFIVQEIPQPVFPTYRLNRDAIIGEWKSLRDAARKAIVAEEKASEKKPSERMREFEIDQLACERASAQMPDWLIVTAGFHVRLR